MRQLCISFGINGPISSGTVGDRPSARRAKLVSASDTDLLRKVGQGDAVAFEVLVGRTNRLLQAACALSFPPADREDAFQRALIDIWRGSAGYRGDSNATTWMYTVARKAAMRGGRPGRSVASDPVADAPEASVTMSGWEDQSHDRAAVADSDSLTARSAA